MKLTQEQQEILNGSRGETMAKVMETLVRYGELYDSDTMIPVTGKNNHLVTSFGLKALTPVYELMDQLIAEGAVSGTKFSADPRPLDKNVPSSFLQNIIFNHFMYSKQDFYEDQLQKLGLMEKDAFTCTCYMDEVGNIPKKGDILSWSESSAVVYANSVLAARCNRNSGIIDLMGAICGFVPRFGLLTDEGRKAHWLIEVKCQSRPEPQLLGSAIGMDKIAMKQILRGAGFPVLDFVWFTREQLKKERQAVIERVEKEIKYPAFIKPAALGSSIGVSRAKNREELAELAQALAL